MFFNIHGSVHFNNILLQKSQKDAHVTGFILSDDCFVLLKIGDNDHPKHVEQSSDKINSVTCVSCWDFRMKL
jgi:hypothetical protein